MRFSFERCLDALNGAALAFIALYSFFLAQCAFAGNQRERSMTFSLGGEKKEGYLFYAVHALCLRPHILKRQVDIAKIYSYNETWILELLTERLTTLK